MADFPYSIVTFLCSIVFDFENNNISFVMFLSKIRYQYSAQ